MKLKLKNIPAQIRNIVLFLGIGFCLTTQAQVKFEREYRITPQKAPKLAVSFIDSCFQNQKIKWFIEESQDGTTFEAKTTHEKVKYSIEFDTLGNPIDVERKALFTTLKNDVQDAIKTSLDTTFKKYKILKTQIQWTADRNVLQQLIREKSTTAKYTVAYEIVLKAKKTNVFNMYEFLFDSKGKLIKELIIKQRNTDNLEF